MERFLSFCRELNNNYAAVLALLVSTITAIITLVYVVFTHNQMKAAQESAHLMEKDLILGRQPCIVPSITKINSNAALSNGRRQMPVFVNLNNIGDAPALSVYCIGYLVLHHTKLSDGSTIVDMFTGPYYLPSVKINEDCDAHIHFENRQIDLLFADLEVSMEKNWERIEKNPSKHHFRGTDIVLVVFYKNMLNQWFESKLTREIVWAKDKIERIPKDGNLNKYTYPPQKITSTTSFELQMISQTLSPLTIQPVTEKHVQDELIRYKERWPDLFYLAGNTDNERKKETI